MTLCVSMEFHGKPATQCGKIIPERPLALFCSDGTVELQIRHLEKFNAPLKKVSKGCHSQVWPVLT